MRVCSKLFNKIIEAENLFSAWDEFKRDKGKKADVLEFENRLEQNIFKLYRDLKNDMYCHGGYKGFWIHDPKPRRIHKASVRDRVLHHAVFKVLNPIFEPTFIPTSFSCRAGKGTHKGILEVEKMIRKSSRNYTRSCCILKCDIKKFFDSVDHAVLFEILNRRIKDGRVLRLLGEIINSYSSDLQERESKKPCSKIGIPIGNLTSQLFANIYMNEFDQFMKHELKIKYYARYTDDFVIVANKKQELKDTTPHIQNFLNENLKLTIHPDKVFIQKFTQGIDFLGQTIFPHYRLIRSKTKKRILRKLEEKVKQYKSGLISKDTLNRSLQSCLGVLSHTNSFTLSEDLKNWFWFWISE